MPAVSVVPGSLFGRRGSRVGGGSVLRKVGGARVLHLRGVYDVLSVVGELDVGRRAGPLAVTSGVASSVSEGCGVRQWRDSPRVGTVGGAGVGSSMCSNVRGLQVSNLGGVDHTTVMGQGSGTIFKETC